MSASLLGLAWQAKVGDSKTRKLVLMKLVDCCDDEGSNIWPALSTVAEHVGCSTQQVRRELKRFCAVGLLRKIRDGGRGTGSTAAYEMDIDLLAKLRRAEFWPALEAAAHHQPAAADDEDEAGSHAPDAREEARGAGGHAPILGDMVSPLHGVTLTSEASRVTSGVTQPLKRTLRSERESAGAQAQEGRPASAAEPDAGHAADAGQAEPAPATLAAFRLAYPHAGADDQAAVASAWEALPFAERRAAIDGIPGFLAERKAAGFNGRLSAPKYLSGRNWQHVPKQAAERAAAQAAGQFVSFKAWSKGWWLHLFDRIRRGAPVKFMVSHADGNPASLWQATTAEMAAAQARIGELRPFRCDGPEIEAWRVWLAGKGARIPAFRGEFRVFLPAPAPPGGRAEDGDDEVRL